MKNRAPCAALTALALCIPVSALPAGRARAVPVQLFRAQMLELVERYEVVLDRLGSEAGRARISEARAALDGVSDGDLAAVFARTGVPDLTPAVIAAEGLLAVTPEPNPGWKELVRDRFFGALDVLPDAPPIISECGNIAHGSTFVFGALIAWQVARGILAAAEFACQETVVVLGEGGNGAAACIPLAIAADAAAIPYELGSFCAGEEDSATLQGTYQRLATVHADLLQVRNDIIADAASNRDTLLANAAANRDLIMANDDANRDAILANANGNRDLIIQEVRALSCELARLLATPEGRRHSEVAACVGQPGYPYDFPER